MPPKAPPKAAGEQVDMSDIASLPKANLCLFQVNYGRFKSTEARNKIKEYLTKTLNPERVKTLTRNEIVEYGKGKGIVEEGEGTKGLSRAQMLAQAAADKLFEMRVAARGQKKQKQIKAQEEADAALPEGQPSVKVETDNDLVDQLIFMPDYPSTKAETLAFS